MSLSLWSVWELAVLALVVWREARGEGELGMRAVACSIRNRVRCPAWWGRDYAEVVTKKWQYSAMTAPGDSQLVKFPAGNDREFAQALMIAHAILTGSVDNPVLGADSYYDDSIPAPKWATAETFVRKVGRLNFHNLDRDYERQDLPAVENGG